MVRIALAALTASFAAQTCAMAAPASQAEQQAEAPQSPAPVEGTAQTVAEQSEPSQTPTSAPSERAAQPAENQADPQRAEQPASAAVERATQPSADAPQPSAAGARFRVEAMGFRAVDESGPNHPDSDAVFAVFESQRQSMVTHVFDSVDTGDAKDFAADENCIFPVRDADEPRNGAWRCSPEGGSGPVRFAIAFYELDPDYVGSFTASFCTPEGPPMSRSVSATAIPSMRICCSGASCLTKSPRSWTASMARAAASARPCATGRATRRARWSTT